MEKLLKNITETTHLVWRENEEKIFKKYGEYRLQIAIRFDDLCHSLPFCFGNLHGASRPH